MNAIPFLFRRKIVNWFRSLIYNKAKLATMILWGAIIIFGFGFTLFGSTVSRQAPQEPGEISSPEVTMIIMSITWSALVIFMFVQGLYQGTKRGSSVYSSADIQFLFTGPVRTQTVLIYGMMNSLQSVLISTFFMIYQIPNMISMGLGVQDFLIFIFSWFLVVMISQLATVCLYLLLLPHQGLAGAVRGFVLAMPLILVAAFVWLVTSGPAAVQGDLLASFNRLISSAWLLLMPFTGWGILLMNATFDGMTAPAFIALGLLLLSGVMIVIYISRSGADYYEDAMNLTYEREAQAARQKSGQITRVKKVRKTGLGKGWGADAFFYRQLREYRRQRPAFLGPPTIFYLMATGGISAMMRGMASDGEFDPADFRTIGLMVVFCGVVAVMFWHGMFSSLLSELESPQFYTAPHGAVTKLLHASRLGVLKVAVDLLPGLILAVVLLGGSLVDGILLLLASLSLYLVISGSQLLVYRLMGQVKGTIETMVLIVLEGAMLIPSLILVVLAFVLFSQNLLNSIWLPLILMTLINTVLYAVTLPAGISALERGLDR